MNCILKKYLPTVLLLSLCFTTTAQALVYYVEFGAGYASVKEPQAMTNSLDPAWTSEFTIPITLGVNLQSRQRGVLFQLGIQSRYLNGSGASKSYTLIPNYGIFRIEFWKLALGFGYSPYVANGLGFQQVPGKAMMGEALLLFPITPEIDFGLNGAYQIFTAQNGNKGPNPAMDVGFFFRLNFGMSKSEANERRKYKGWRYPFGVPLN